MNLESVEQLQEVMSFGPTLSYFGPKNTNQELEIVII
jgi:hypothetical protein